MARPLSRLGKGKVYRPTPELTEPIWERQPDEGERAWRMFKIYRDLGFGRTLNIAARDAGYPINALGTHAHGKINAWSIVWRWRERVAEFEKYEDRRNTEAKLRAQEKEQARNAGKWAGRAEELLDAGFLAAQELRKKATLAINEPHEAGRVSLKDAGLMLAKALEISVGILAAATKPIDQYKEHELQAIAEATTHANEVAVELAVIDEFEREAKLQQMLLFGMDSDGGVFVEDDGDEADDDAPEGQSDDIPPDESSPA